MPHNTLCESPENRPVATVGCRFQPAIDSLRTRLNAALCGKSDVVEYVLASLLARGHILIEDLPGLGKTTLAKALAHAVGGRFARVQCTPDLLPSDVTGFNMFNQRTREFEFQAGPVFADVLLADEINRATPRTQSALFEAMSERQVTVDNHCHRLSDTFFVIATQNPVESHGTYPLPEAQLDRFAVKLGIGYPGRQAELEMLGRNIGSENGRAPTCEALLTPEELATLQEHVATVAVADTVREYLVDLTRATRENQEVTIGVSPRGLLAWLRMAQAWAHLQGRGFVTPDDVLAVAQPVLQVRLSGDYQSREQLVNDILDTVPVPA